MPSSDIRFPQEAVAALARGELIQAIKIVRQANGLDLKEAKDAVEAYLAHPDTASRLKRALGAQAGSANLVVPQQAIDALAHGQLIAAIKHVRAANPQLGLKEAKDAVDALVRKTGRSQKGPSNAQRVPTVVQGDTGGSGWLWLLAAAIAAAVWWWMAGRG